MLESFFNKVAGPAEHATLIKEGSSTGAFL